MSFSQWPHQWSQKWLIVLLLYQDRYFHRSLFRRHPSLFRLLCIWDFHQHHPDEELMQELTQSLGQAEPAKSYINSLWNTNSLVTLSQSSVVLLRFYWNHHLSESASVKRILMLLRDWDLPCLDLTWRPNKFGLVLFDNWTYINIMCFNFWITRAPTDCVQYFTGITGSVANYGFGSGDLLTNQQYTNCIRTEVDHLFQFLGILLLQQDLVVTNLTTVRVS